MPNIGQGLNSFDHFMSLTLPGKSFSFSHFFLGYL